MGHAHAHAHTHAEGEGKYYLDQLFTIVVCGALGLIAVLMYQTDMLNRILVPMFFVPVLVGGVTVLVFVAIRATAVWHRANARVLETPNCIGHDHAHVHTHGSEMHGGHDHGWAPWRYMILAIPVFLYLLDLPRAGGLSIPDQRGAGELQHSPERQSLAALSGGAALTTALRKSEPRRLTLRFHELSEAAAVPSRREIYEGDIGIIRGQYLPLRRSDRDFSLFRWKVTCCKGDAVPMKARIEAPEPIWGIRDEQWIRVEGVITFRKDEKGRWIAVINLKSNDDIIPIEPPANDSDGF